MNDWAIIYNFRFIDWKNQILFSNDRKTVLVHISKFRKMQDLILAIIKKQHPSAFAVDFDHAILSSPYLNN